MRSAHAHLMLVSYLKFLLMTKAKGWERMTVFPRLKPAIFLAARRGGEGW
jgi:hypothetical protein